MSLKRKTYTEVIVDKLPQCDFCKRNPLILYQEAHYDGRTVFDYWAFMCDEHFGQYGVGLGLSRGQRLIERREYEMP